MNRLLQQFAIWCGIGYALQAAGLALTDALFWCILALVLLAEYLARAEGKEFGIMINGQAVINLIQQRDELTERLQQYEQHSSTSEPEQRNL